MTEEEKKVIANDIEKYFLRCRINHTWFSLHFEPLLEIPDDGFEPRTMSKIKIYWESIEQLDENLFGFSGSANVLFREKASGVDSYAYADFWGKASTISQDGRTPVGNVLLTRIHRTTDFLPKQ